MGVQSVLERECVGELNTQDVVLREESTGQYLAYVWNDDMSRTKIFKTSQQRADWLEHWHYGWTDVLLFNMVAVYKRDGEKMW